MRPTLDHTCVPSGSRKAETQTRCNTIGNRVAGINFRRGDAVVWLDVTKVDEAWKSTDQYVVAGGANGHGNRYNQAGEWFAANGFSDMPFITVNSGRISFTDGRHRFAWLRDNGVKAIQFQVPPDQADELCERCGTHLTESVVEIPREASDTGGTQLD